MAVTDPERADALDALTPDELETLAFGPEPRRLRGLVRRRPALPARTSGRPQGRGGVLAALALAAGLVGAGIAVAVGPAGAHDHGDLVFYDDPGVYEEIEFVHEHGEALTDEGELVEMGEEVLVEYDEVVEDLFVEEDGLVVY